MPALRLPVPRLWWPNGYGEPNLYHVELRFETGRAASRTRSPSRPASAQFTYSEEGGTLRMWINGRRFMPRGGNWGFPESMLRYRGREYDAAVRYHSDMNFTMIRNWVGQTGDDEFYEACDRHGIVVWQDFWLANPWDGPDPDDDALFMANATDLVIRIRNHPSVGLYCGRNEGYPPKPLDDAHPRAAGRAASRPALHLQFGRRRGQRPRAVPGHAAEPLLPEARHAEVPQRDGHAEHRDHRQPAGDDARGRRCGRWARM